MACDPDEYVDLGGLCKRCRLICPEQDESWDLCQEECPGYLRMLSTTVTMETTTEMTPVPSHNNRTLTISLSVTFVVIVIICIIIVMVWKFRHRLKRPRHRTEGVSGEDPDRPSANLSSDPQEDLGLLEPSHTETRAGSLGFPPVPSDIPAGPLENTGCEERLVTAQEEPEVQAPGPSKFVTKSSLPGASTVQQDTGPHLDNYLRAFQGTFVQAGDNGVDRESSIPRSHDTGTGATGARDQSNCRTDASSDCVEPSAPRNVQGERIRHERDSLSLSLHGPGSAENHGLSDVSDGQPPSAEPTNLRLNISQATGSSEGAAGETSPTTPTTQFTVVHTGDFPSTMENRSDYGLTDLGVQRRESNSKSPPTSP